MSLMQLLNVKTGAKSSRFATAVAVAVADDVAVAAAGDGSTPEVKKKKVVPH